MIVYHQAFDLYHCVYRMLQLLTYFDKDQYVEVDRLRIWDFYLLFPEKMHSISLKQDEKDIRQIIKEFIPKKNNPYEIVIDDRKLFEKIKPYQITAVKCLASYDLINKRLLTENRVSIISKKLLEDHAAKFESLTDREMNVVKLLTAHFSQVSMFGPYGLKARTKLLESKYDT